MNKWEQFLIVKIGSQKVGLMNPYDPYPSTANMCDMLWLYAKDHVARLTWDLRGWFWSHSLGE